MKGIRLVEINSELSIINHDYQEGNVQRDPSVKYRYEKEDPADPTRILRYGKYHLDKFKCQITVDPDEYTTILNFLKTVDLFDPDVGTGLYIQYDHGSQNQVYPITSIQDLPPAANELQIMPDQITFTLESRYKELSGLPGFTAYNAENYGEDLYNW